MAPELAFFPFLKARRTRRARRTLNGGALQRPPRSPRPPRAFSKARSFPRRHGAERRHGDRFASAPCSGHRGARPRRVAAGAAAAPWLISTKPEDTEGHREEPCTGSPL